jgi:hypothetical protein
MLVFMGPLNRCSLLSTDVLTFITTSMVVLGEKLGGGPKDRSAGLGVVLGALFLGSHMWTAHRKHTRGIHELTWKAYVLYVSGFSLQGVH